MILSSNKPLKDYGRLLGDDPRYATRSAALAAKVRDVTEVLADLESQRPYGHVDLTVAYHDACHLAHAQGVRPSHGPCSAGSRVSLRPLAYDGSAAEGANLR
jgi:hypothetical protein